MGDDVPMWLRDLFAVGVIIAIVGAIATAGGYFTDTYPVTLTGSLLMTLGVLTAAVAVREGTRMSDDRVYLASRNPPPGTDVPLPPQETP